MVRAEPDPEVPPVHDLSGMAGDLVPKPSESVESIPREQPELPGIIYVAIEVPAQRVDAESSTRRGNLFDLLSSSIEDQGKTDRLRSIIYTTAIAIAIGVGVPSGIIMFVSHDAHVWPQIGAAAAGVVTAVTAIQRVNRWRHGRRSRKHAAESTTTERPAGHRE